MKTGSIFFIINRKAGASSNSEPEVLIDQIMSEHKIAYEIFYLSDNDDTQEIKKRIRRFKPGIVVASGGDGTINYVASIIIEFPVQLGIIPSGSANGLAFELGIPENTEEALKLIFSGTAQPLDAVKINDSHISLHLSDVGINARLVKAFEKDNSRGFRGYIKHFFKEIITPQKGFKCVIRTDQGEFKHKALMTVIANASRYRTGANINIDGKMDDGFFEIVVIRPYQSWIWKSFMGALRGKFNQQPHIKTYKCTSALIQTFPMQELQIDGESLGKTGEISAIIHKHALQVIR